MDLFWEAKYGMKPFNMEQLVTMREKQSQKQDSAQAITRHYTRRLSGLSLDFALTIRKGEVAQIVNE